MNLKFRIHIHSTFKFVLMNVFILDIDEHDPPEPAPEDTIDQKYNVNAIAIKQPSSFVLKIDKNGDQIHEEFIPQNHQGKLIQDPYLNLGCPSPSLAEDLSSISHLSSASSNESKKSSV
jgi:hypothetical protein